MSVRPRRGCRRRGTPPLGQRGPKPARHAHAGSAPLQAPASPLRINSTEISLSNPLREGDSPFVDYRPESARLSTDRPVSRRGSVTLALLLGLLLALGGFFGFAAPVGALFLRPVMRVRLFVVLAALAAEEEQDWLAILSAHVEIPQRIKGSLGPTTTRKTFSGSDLSGFPLTPEINASHKASDNISYGVFASLGNERTFVTTVTPCRLPLADIISGRSENGASPFGFIGTGKSTRHLASTSRPYISHAREYASPSSLGYTIDTAVGFGRPSSFFKNGARIICRCLLCSLRRSSWSSASACFCLACAVSSRITSSSLSWSAWSFREARSTQPETKTSIATPTITSFAPNPFHPSSHSPAATRMPPTIDATSNAASTHSQRCLIVIVVTLFALNKIAAFVVERWK